jgi:hypothetical protein
MPTAAMATAMAVVTAATMVAKAEATKTTAATVMDGGTDTNNLMWQRRKWQQWQWRLGRQPQRKWQWQQQGLQRRHQLRRINNSKEDKDNMPGMCLAGKDHPIVLAFPLPLVPAPRAPKACQDWEVVHQQEILQGGAGDLSNLREGVHLGWKIGGRRQPLCVKIVWMEI